MNLPRYLFPSTHNTPLTIGTVNGIGIDDQMLFAQNNTQTETLERTKLCFIKGPATIQRPPEMFKVLDGTSERMVIIINKNDYYRGRYCDPVDSDFLKSVVKDELLEQRKLKKFDRFAGNKLEFLKDFELLAMPTTETFNQLTLYSVKRSNKIIYPDERHDSVEFSLPINQIKSFNEMIMARTMQGIHIGKLGSLEEINKFEFGSQPCHFAFNNQIPGDSLVVLGDSRILSWDYQYNKYSTRLDGLDMDHFDDRHNMRICEYGAHPRTLLATSGNEIQLIDLRKNQQNSNIQFISSSIITSLSKNPVCPFEVCFVGENETTVFDLRVPKKSLLSWGLNDSYEYQFFVEYCDIPIFTERNRCTSSFVTYGRHRGDILMYGYEKSGDLPPVSKSINMLDCFSKHEFISNPSIDMMQPRSFECITYQTYFREREHMVPFPTLDGLTMIPHDNRSFTMMQYSGDGGLFIQGYSFESTLSLPADTIEMEASVKNGIIEKVSNLPSSAEECKNEIIDLSPLINDFERRLVPNTEASWLRGHVFARNDQVWNLCRSAEENLGVLETESGVPGIPPINMITKSECDEFLYCSRDLPAPAELIELPFDEHILDELDIDIPYVDQYKILSRYLLENELKLSRTVIWPYSTKYHIGNSESVASHKSIIRSPLILQDLKLESVASWLNQQWELDVTEIEEEHFTTEEVKIRKAKRRLSVSSASSRESLKVKAEKLDPPVIQSSQPQRVPTISQSQSTQKAKSQPTPQKLKRKRGF